MNIPMLSVINNHAKLNDAVSLAVTKMAMNTSKDTATAMNEMLSKAVNPNLGTKLDVSA